MVLDVDEALKRENKDEKTLLQFIQSNIRIR